MFEHRRQPLLGRRAFLRRSLRHVAFSVGMIVASLGLGTLGYHGLEGLPWIDAVLNAAMILSGMGPVSPLHTAAGKLFATGYALFSGVVFVSTAAVLVAPWLHRLLHRLHLEEEREDDARDGTRADPPLRPAG